MKEEKAHDVSKEETIDEIADLEEYAKKGKRPPYCRGYRFKVNPSNGKTCGASPIHIRIVFSPYNVPNST